jgi:hypothetical protein
VEFGNLEIVFTGSIKKFDALYFLRKERKQFLALSFARYYA